MEGIYESTELWRHLLGIRLLLLEYVIVSVRKFNLGSIVRGTDVGSTNHYKKLFCSHEVSSAMVIQLYLVYSTYHLVLSTYYLVLSTYDLVYSTYYLVY